MQAKTGDGKQAATIYMHVALAHPQNWAAIQGFLDCVLTAANPTASATPTNGAVPIYKLSISPNGSSGLQHINGSAHGSDADIQVQHPAKLSIL